MPEFLVLMWYFIDSPLGYLTLGLSLAVGIYEYRSA